MSTDAAAFAPELRPVDRLEVLFEELSELTGQRNAVNARILDIIAEIDRGGMAGITGARSLSALVAWKTGVTPRNAESLVAIVERLDQFPQCTTAMREGRLSLDQVGVIAEHAADGSDAHYAQLAAVATVTQLRTAIKLEPRPEPKPKTDPKREFIKHDHGEHTTYRITLSKLEAARFDTALQAHHDAQIAQWKHDHENDGESVGDQTPPLPNRVDAFMGLVDAGWDVEVARRPHAQHTTVTVHFDPANPAAAALHLGPVLSDEERQYLLCDATFELWLHQHGQPIGVGRATRAISRRLRRALEHRDHCCVVPGCGATRGLHAHHLVHWEHGGATELHNLVLVCPHHHRAHHRGDITLTGPADRLVVTDHTGNPLQPGPLARPPKNPPPTVAPCPGPTGERADWWWYTPFQPPPPTTN